MGAGGGKCNYFLSGLSGCSLGHGIPGVDAVHAVEPVYGMDTEPQQEASVQAPAVGAVAGIHCVGRRGRDHAGRQVLIQAPWLHISSIDGFKVLTISVMAHCF